MLHNSNNMTDTSLVQETLLLPTNRETICANAMGRWYLKTRPFPICYHAELKRVCVRKGNCKNGSAGPAPKGHGHCWPQKYAPPHVLPCQIWTLYCRSNSTSVITEFRHPRDPPFKVTWGHRNSHGLVGYLWLPINIPSNGGPILYSFQDTARYRPKIVHVVKG